jgi:O-antigen/teichoic acid export membrane protein
VRRTLSILLPVVLVRCLDAQSFGQYRLLWLVIGTFMAVAPLAMPQSLYFFLPRSDAAEQKLHIHQTLLFLACTGMLAALALGPWNPLLPASVRSLNEYGGWVSVFVALWAIASLLDLLPTVEERVTWQAGVTVSMSLVRALSLASAAYLTADLRVVIQTLVAFVALKLVLLFSYVAHYHGLTGTWFNRKAFLVQLRHAAPYGLSGALSGFRVQADQWVAASLFSLSSFAAFSIAAVLTPLLNLFRQSVNHAFLPSMSRLHAKGDVTAMLELNSRANLMVGMIAFPLLAFAFGFAEELVTLVYTSAYLDAAPVMRVYIVGLIALVVELASVVLLLRQGPFAMRLNALTLGVTIAISWGGALHFGLPGAALGSVSAIYLDRVVTLMRIAAQTGIPLRRLQDWRSLGLLLLLSIAAGAVARGIVGLYFASSGVPVRLAVGGASLALVYAVSIALSRFGLDGTPRSTRSNVDLGQTS